MGWQPARHPLRRYAHPRRRADRRPAARYVGSLRAIRTGPLDGYLLKSLDVMPVRPARARAMANAPTRSYGIWSHTCSYIPRALTAGPRPASCETLRWRRRRRWPSADASEPRSAPGVAHRELGLHAMRAHRLTGPRTLYQNLTFTGVAQSSHVSPAL